MPPKFSVFTKSGNSHFLRRTVSVLLALVILLIAVSPAGGMTFNRKLSAETPQDFGPVESYYFSPDSKYVVYTTATLVPGFIELFSVAATGSKPVKLNLDLVNGGKVDGESIAITPDSQKVIYMADQNGDSLWEIYIVPIGGGVSRKLSSAFMTPDGGVYSYALAPSGEWIVYRADQEYDEVYELYSVSLATETVTKLNGSFFPDRLDRDVHTFLIRPDSEGVVFLTNWDSLSRYELYGNSMDGEHLVKLSGTTIPGAVSTYLITADTVNPRVVFMASRDHAAVELYGHLLDSAGEPVRLSRDLTGAEFVETFALTHDGLGVVYSICADIHPNQDYLYSRTFASSVTYKLNGAAALPILDIQITPNDARVVFLSENDLFSNGIANHNGEPVKINESPSGDGYVSTFQITYSSAGAAGVVYIQNQTAGAGFDLYSAYAAGGPTHYQLNQSLQPNDGVTNYAISPDDAWVVYISDQETDGVDEVYLNSILGGTPAKLNLPISIAAGDVRDFKISPNSKLVVYRVDRDVDNFYELYVTFNGFGVFLPAVLRP